VSRFRSSGGRSREHPLLVLEVPVAMAAVCEVCGKKPSFGMNVSHSHRRTKRRWNPNIQRVRAVVDGSPRRVHVCTSCLKAGKIQKAAR
jgi:large subunit ribosomal protein L28